VREDLTEVAFVLQLCAELLVVHQVAQDLKRFLLVPFITLTLLLLHVLFHLAKLLVLFSLGGVFLILDDFGVLFVDFSVLIFSFIGDKDVEDGIEEEFLDNLVALVKFVAGELSEELDAEVAIVLVRGVEETPELIHSFAFLVGVELN